MPGRTQGLTICSVFLYLVCRSSVVTVFNGTFFPFRSWFLFVQKMVAAVFPENCTHVHFSILSWKESMRICAWIARAKCEIFSLFSDKIFQNSFSLVVIFCFQYYLYFNQKTVRRTCAWIFSAAVFESERACSFGCRVLIFRLCVVMRCGFLLFG